MYGLFAGTKQSGRCKEVSVSGGSTIATAGEKAFYYITQLFFSLLVNRFGLQTIENYKSATYAHFRSLTG